MSFLGHAPLAGAALNATGLFPANNATNACPDTLLRTTFDAVPMFRNGMNSTPHLLRNNLSIAGGSADAFTSGSLMTNNRWQVLASVSAGDLQSTDVSLPLLPRADDGSLPPAPFLKPVPGGQLIDRGVDIGQPFSGAAPDVGAFEVP